MGSRRSFLKSSILGGTGAILSTSFLSRTHAEPAVQNTGKIITRKLGNTGIELPIVSFGVMRADSPALIVEALKDGFVHFDTAHGYQNGKNEEMLGEIFKNVSRKTFVVSTKVQPTATAKEFLEKFDLSLKRLKLEYVDILYLHAVQSRDGVLSKEMMDALAQAKKSGKAKHIGVSTHKNEPEVIRAAIESKFYEVVLTSINFKQAHYAEVKKACAEAAAAGIGIVAMKTMAGGFLDKERKKPVNCKAALKFVMLDENVTTSIPGIINFDQLKMNGSVNYDLVLTEAEKTDLSAMNYNEAGLYCQGCETCLDNCSKGLPIPDLMRAYMYAYGYKDSSQAKNVLEGLAISENPCSSCTSCNVVCAKKFNVQEKITDVTRLSAVPAEFLV